MSIEHPFIVNAYGAKIYLNTEADQPKLHVSEGNPIQKYVLAVGVVSDTIPVITTAQGDDIIAYTAPKELLDWCKSCISLSMKNKNLFPANCRFSLIDGKYYADIL